MAKGGIFFPDLVNGLYKFVAPKHFEVRRAAALRDAKDSDVADARNSSLKLHRKWRHASAHLLRRILVDAEGPNQRSSSCAGEVVSQREVCPAFEKAPDLTAARTSSASPSKEEIRAGLNVGIQSTFPGRCHRLTFYGRVLKVPPPDPGLPEESVRSATAGLWIAVIGILRAIQMDAGLKGGNEIRTDRCKGIQFREGLLIRCPWHAGTVRHVAFIIGRWRF